MNKLTGVPIRGIWASRPKREIPQFCANKPTGKACFLLIPRLWALAGSDLGGLGRPMGRQAPVGAPEGKKKAAPWLGAARNRWA